jgi:hypothetical protein
MASKINGNQNGNQEKEIDPFDAILNIEEEQTKLGHQQGQKIQKIKFTLEGFNLGLSKGFEAGSEIAFYQAFAKTWLSHPNISGKEKKVLEQLLKLTQKYPEHNSKEEETGVLKQSMNAKFKQACAVLKIDAKNSTQDFTW